VTILKPDRCYQRRRIDEFGNLAPADWYFGGAFALDPSLDTLPGAFLCGLGVGDDLLLITDIPL
jgi:hypothetical protein